MMKRSVNYNNILKEFTEHPRDVHTVPIVSKKPVWFFTYTEKGYIYVESAHHKLPKSSLKRRRLNESECEDMYALYLMRKAGKSVSREAQERTRSQVYWFGIFSALSEK